MRVSLAISLAVHAAILLAAVVVLPSPDLFKVEEMDTIPVDIVSIEDVSKRQATVKAPEAPVEKPAPPKPVVETKESAPKPAEEVKQAAVEPQAEPEPVPEPKVEPKLPDPKPIEDLIKKMEEKPKEQPKTAEAPKVKPKPKPEKPKKKLAPLDVDKVAALLNKIDDDRTAPPKKKEETGTPLQGQFDFASGSDEKMAANEIDWLRRKIEECWNPPVGVQEAQNLVVQLQIELDQGGNVIGTPQIANTSSHPLFEVAANSAVRAVMRCQPYDRLPPQKYESWRSIILNFDPRQMFSG
jgi:outer membrane biosynthesis protein TonB